MNVLVTGGAGYIGSELVSLLSANPKISNVKVYDNLSQRNYSVFLDRRLDSKKISFINGDIFDTDKLIEALRDVDVVFHLAGYLSGLYADHDDHLFNQVNKFGSGSVVEALNASNVGRVAYLSTTRVYEISDDPVNNGTTLLPSCLYSQSMLEAESKINSISDKISSYVFRCADVYGYSSGMNYFSLINRLMFEVNFLGRIRVDEHPEQLRPYVHLNQVIMTLNDITSETPSLSTGTYNLSGSTFSTEQIVNALALAYPEGEISWAIHQNLPQNLIITDHSCPIFNGISTYSLSEEFLRYKKVHYKVLQAEQILA